MPTPEAEAHITAQERLRVLTVQGVGNAWDRLPSVDEESVAPFLAIVVPLVLAAQRHSVNLANAYLAWLLRRAPLPIDAEGAVATVRGGTTPVETYRRPFVTVWSDLKDSKPYADAVVAGRTRAMSSAALDVQMAQRAGLQAVQEADPTIYGFARAADSSACPFCRLVDGAYVKRADAMALHANCGCSLVPLTGVHPRAAKLPDGTPVSDLRAQDSVEGTVVHLHGEYGPTLTDPTHHFTGPDQIAA